MFWGVSKHAGPFKYVSEHITMFQDMFSILLDVFETMQDES
jgi:hypothetical protein